MKSFLTPALIISVTLLLYSPAVIADETTINFDAQALQQKAALSLSPITGSFQEGSTFDVGIFLDTRGGTMNTVELHISFPPDKLALIKPLGDRSIIGVWLEPPKYSNTSGTAEFNGIIPNGIKTTNGLIGTLTFRAMAPGQATVKILNNSKVLINDGVGTEAITDLGRSSYTLVPKPPEGVTVFSETHPIQDRWYNNNNPVVTWDQDVGVTSFAYTIDTEPATVPDGSSTTSGNTVAFPKRKDGVWYFHIKAFKNGVWGSATHFALHIDTAPPADFRPEAQIIDANHVLISYFTTDILSGVSSYEVGVIDRSQPAIESPAFVPAESPYQLPKVPGNANVVVRAIDRAGNVKDVTIPVRISLNMYLQDNTYLIWLLSLIMLGLGVFHYFFRHHLVAHARRFMALWKKEEEQEYGSVTPVEIHENIPEVKMPEIEQSKDNETPKL
ncbi:MAG: cohesin domain-containing protein [bacterium]|nr:cohesin domain-containing protein [bacterium]